MNNPHFKLVALLASTIETAAHNIISSPSSSSSSISPWSQLPINFKRRVHCASVINFNIIIPLGDVNNVPFRLIKTKFGMRVAVLIERQLIFLPARFSEYIRSLSWRRTNQRPNCSAIQREEATTTTPNELEKRTPLTMPYSGAFSMDYVWLHGSIP